MLATQVPRTNTRTTLTIDADTGKASSAKVAASAGFKDLQVIARGTGLTPQHAATPIREFETG